MIVVETLLRDIFSQIPDVTDKNGKAFKVKFHWGGQDDLNLYMKQESGNKTPLIWLVQGEKDRIDHTELLRKVRIIIAKDSTHKISRNPVVWETEFEDYLNPILANVITALKRSGTQMIVEGTQSVYREANYSYERDEQGNVTNTTDFWNVITYEAELRFYQEPHCIQKINFN